MAISYPIAIPNTNSIVQFNLDAVNAVAYSQSPFTFAGQSHAYAGQMWQLSATLKPMRRSQAPARRARQKKARARAGRRRRRRAGRAVPDPTPRRARQRRPTSERYPRGCGIPLGTGGTGHTSPVSSPAARSGCVRAGRRRNGTPERAWARAVRPRAESAATSGPSPPE